jgi:hypothetical protein
MVMRELAETDTQEATGLVVNDKGRLFIRHIAKRFDRYLTAARERRFSKTI